MIKIFWSRNENDKELVGIPITLRDPKPNHSKSNGLGAKLWARLLYVTHFVPITGDGTQLIMIWYNGTEAKEEKGDTTLLRTLCKKDLTQWNSLKKKKHEEIKEEKEKANCQSFSLSLHCVLHYLLSFPMLKENAEPSLSTMMKIIGWLSQEWWK